MTRWWLSDNNVGVATVYHGKGGPFPPGNPTVAKVPAPGATTGSGPTGDVFNDNPRELISIGDDVRARDSRHRAPVSADRPAEPCLRGLEISQLPRTKRAFDLIFALSALIVVTPLLLVLALVIVVDSWGSPIFVQERVGIGGRCFRMLKLRTMFPDAESRLSDVVHLNERDGPLFKICEDPRQTRVGRFLRASCLDELPQLVNIVRGDMSLVGPRPPLPCEVASYNQAQARRLSVTPGLTGAWQVSSRAELDWETAVRLDLDYIDNWSLRGDLKLILMTIASVVSLRGAH
jgi:lipopolysaccharide/colanic/teichoic acid biosynthesis glycosyltransferase